MLMPAMRACDPWQFAVEICRLLDLGVTLSDVRWLVEKGYVIHAHEVTQPGDCARKFAPARNTAVSKDSCCLLTNLGLSFVAGASWGGTFLHLVGGEPAVADAAPHWDGKDRILRLGWQIVKRFRWPSPNQQIILTVFEEEGWPRRIDDPLSPLGKVDPKHRLQETIKWLNKGHETRLLRFTGDGTGEAVCWSRLASGDAADSAQLARKLRVAP